MFSKETWAAAVKAAAIVINDKRSATHTWSADEIAYEALKAAALAAFDKTTERDEEER